MWLYSATPIQTELNSDTLVAIELNSDMTNQTAQLPIFPPKYLNVLSRNQNRTYAKRCRYLKNCYYSKYSE